MKTVPLLFLCGCYMGMQMGPSAHRGATPDLRGSGFAAAVVVGVEASFDLRVRLGYALLASGQTHGETRQGIGAHLLEAGATRAIRRWRLRPEVVELHFGGSAAAGLDGQVTLAAADGFTLTADADSIWSLATGIEAVLDRIGRSPVAIALGVGWRLASYESDLGDGSVATPYLSFTVALPLLGPLLRSRASWRR